MPNISRSASATASTVTPFLPAKRLASSAASPAEAQRSTRVPPCGAIVMASPFLVEDRDRQTVILAVRALGHDLVDDLDLVFVQLQPPRRRLPQLVAFFLLRCAEHLYAIKHVYLPRCGLPSP